MAIGDHFDNTGDNTPAPAAQTSSVTELMNKNLAAGMASAAAAPQGAAQPVFKPDAFTNYQGGAQSVPESNMNFAQQPSFQFGTTAAAPAFDISEIFGTSRRGSGEETARAITALTKEINGWNERNQAGKVSNLKALVVEGREAGVLRSAIILSCVYRGSPTIHVLVLDGSGDPIESKKRSFAGKDYEEPVLPGDYVNADYQAGIGRQLARMGHGGLVSGYVVIPRGFRWDDAGAVGTLLRDSIIAMESAQIANIGFSVKQLGGALNVTVGLGNGHNEGVSVDALGAPVRNTIIARLVRQDAPQGSSAPNGLNQSSTTTHLGDFNAFVDFRWAPGPVMQPMPGQPAMRTPPFQPVLVVRNFRSEQSSPLGMQLLVLSSVVPIIQSGLWRASLIPSASGDELRNIGGLNVQGNLAGEGTYGRYLDVAPGDTQTFGQIMTNLVKPDPEVRIMVSDTGSDWYNATFRLASGHPSLPETQEAQGRLIAAMDALTDNGYSNYFIKRNQQVQPLVAGNRTPIHMGEWTDARGQQRDLAEIDGLVVDRLLGSHDGQLSQQFYDSWVAHQNIPSAMLMEARLQIMRRVANDRLTVTGRGWLVQLNTGSLLALADTMIATGSLPRLTTHLSGGTDDMRPIYQAQGVSFAGMPIYGAGQGGGGGAAPMFGGGVNTGGWVGAR